MTAGKRSPVIKLIINRVRPVIGYAIIKESELQTTSLIIFWYEPTNISKALYR